MTNTCLDSSIMKMEILALTDCDHNLFEGPVIVIYLALPDDTSKDHNDGN